MDTINYQIELIIEIIIRWLSVFPPYIFFTILISAVLFVPREKVKDYLLSILKNACIGWMVGVIFGCYHFIKS